MPNAFVSGIAQNQVNKPGSIYSGDTKNDYKNEFQLSGPTGPNPFVHDQSQDQNGPNNSWNTSNVYSGENGSHWEYSPSGSGWVQYGAPGNFQQKQQLAAMDFRKDIPQTENNLFNQLSGSVNAQMHQGIQNVKQANSSRGLLYGGINAGGEQGVRSNASAALSHGRSSINSQVEGAANQMDQSAIETGVAIQQTQQQMQNLIYQNALAQMNMQNGALSGLLGAGGMAAGMYLGAGTGAGAAGGGLLGQQAGKMV